MEKKTHLSGRLGRSLNPQKSLSFFPSERSEVKGDSNVLPEKFPSSNHPFVWMERKPGSLWSVLGYPGLQEPSRLPFSFHPPQAVKGDIPNYLQASLTFPSVPRLGL